MLIRDKLQRFARYLRNRAYNTGVQRNCKIDFRSPRAVNGMDLWYKVPANRDRVVKIAKTMHDSKIEELEKVDTDVSGSDSDSDQGSEVGKSKKPAFVGILASVKARLYHELPENEHKEWEDKARHVKEETSANKGDRAFMYVLPPC